MPKRTLAPSVEKVVSVNRVQPGEDPNQTVIRLETDQNRVLDVHELTSIKHSDGWKLEIAGKLYPDGRTEQQRGAFRARERERLTRIENEAKIVKPTVVEPIPQPDVSPVEKQQVIRSEPTMRKNIKLNADTASSGGTAVANKPKKAAKKKVKAKAAKKSTGVKDPNILRKPMFRILNVLNKNARLERAAVASKAEVDAAFCSQYLGRLDPKKRAEADKSYGFKSLMTLGYVRAEEVDHKGKDTTFFMITAAGKAALERHNKAVGKK